MRQEKGWRTLTSLVMLVSLTGCLNKGSSNVCPYLVDYSNDRQAQLKIARQKADSEVINEYIINYRNLRERVRECRK